MLLTCCLLHITIIKMRHILYLELYFTYRHHVLVHCLKSVYCLVKSQIYDDDNYELFSRNSIKGYFQPFAQ